MKSVAAAAGAALLAATVVPAANAATPCAHTVPGMAIEKAVIDLAVAATDPVPHCNIYGRIDTRTGVDGKTYSIGFNLRLPDNWNGRFVELGGGGTDGSIPTADPFTPFSAGLMQLSSGYAITSNDGGHEDASSSALAADPHLVSQQDDARGGTAHFGADPKARNDFGFNAMAKTADVAKYIVGRYYHKRPSYSYFQGCSNGGREAFMAAQRFPDLFDGIAAKSPGFDLPRAAVAEAWNQQALEPLVRNAPTDPTSNPKVHYFGDAISSADFDLIASAINAACDKLDGVADGMVNDFLACTNARVIPELTKIKCAGAKNATCLAPATIHALTRIIGGPRNSKGQQLYAFNPNVGTSYRAFPWDPGAGQGWPIWMLAIVPQAKPVNTALNLTLGGGALPSIFVTPPVLLPTTPATGGDARANYILKFDFDRDAPKIFRSTPKYPQSSIAFMAATSSNLDAFKRRGGKMIISHGTADGVFSVTDTARWYNALDRRMRGNAADFVRLFVVPGMGHCGGGPATSSYDDFTTLVNWVEKKVAPTRVTATAPTGSTFAGRSRPLCPYPKYARYLGGDVEKASSFACTEPSHFSGRELDGFE